jgi:glycerate kinase
VRRSGRHLPATDLSVTRDVDWLIAEGSLALVETAGASGLGLVGEPERDAESASTFGAGELIAAAVAAGAALDELRDAGHALAAAACST